ncbi:unnamed protein product [Mytilus edulis]|uniref:Uncharacterized protein n=1 Tax=Mytilus edulis TaxID=6550 RepID=A0A8S3T509_MYTED|nr:unnamed protein product [Mytilus edulis]
MIISEQVIIHLYHIINAERSDTDKVDPALTLTPELINQVERKETKKCDFDKMLAVMNDQWSDKWPYTGYSISDESQLQKQPASELSDLDLSLPSIDLSLTLTEFWPGCSTVLIDVCPWCLLTNHSTLDLVFIDSSKETWPLPQGKTFSPPKLQQKSRLITKLDFMQVAEWTANLSQHWILSKPCKGLLHLMPYGCSQLRTVCDLILINPYPGIPSQRILRQWFDSADEIFEGGDLLCVSIDVKSTA